MVNREFLAKMKPTPLLINTAWGSIVDEAALYDALFHRKIFGAGLDAFLEEPTAGDNPLLRLENVVATPHVGGNTADMNGAMIDRVIHNILLTDRGEELPRGDLVNGVHTGFSYP